jgi:predicted transcriptional regulator
LPPVSLSIKVDENLKLRMENQARRERQSVDDFTLHAIQNLVEEREYFYEQMEIAEAEADKGIFISGEAMHRWMASWGTDNELPPPEPDIFPEGDKRQR